MGERRSREPYRWTRVRPVARRSASSWTSNLPQVARARDTPLLSRLKAVLPAWFGGTSPAARPPAESAVAASEGPLSFTEALATVGVPVSGLAPEDELVDLLENASEVEQGLMVQYLYSYYSCSDVLIGGILNGIAIEEMGHFVTVQNLLLSCGQPPFLGTDDWTGPSLFHPFPFRLEPASAGSLAKYTIAEMPDGRSVPADIRADLPTIQAEAAASAGGPVEPHRVGLLYAQIYWLLRPDDAPLNDPSQEPWIGFPVEDFASVPELRGRHVRSDFFRDVSRESAVPDHWQGNHNSVIVRPIATRKNALCAIADIAEQGEGFGQTPQSHFERFVDAWRKAKRGDAIAMRVPTNPWYRAPQDPANVGTGDEITSQLGIRFATLGDLAYELILLATAANLLLPASAESALRGKAAKAAILAMRECLRPIATTLAQLPLKQDDASDAVCGLPFMRTPLRVGSDLPAVLDRARAVMGEITAMAAQIAESDAPGTAKSIAEAVSYAIADDISPRLEELVRGGQ